MKVGREHFYRFVIDVHAIVIGRHGYMIVVIVVVTSFVVVIALAAVVIGGGGNGDSVIYVVVLGLNTIQNIKY